jgi:hypothetical protein
MKTKFFQRCSLFFSIEFLQKFQKGVKELTFLKEKLVLPIFARSLIFWAFFLISCAKDEPAKELTPQEQAAAKLIANTWVLEGIFFTGTDVTDLRPDLALRNTTLKFNKDNTYNTQPSSVIFKIRENWLLPNKDNLRINLFTKEEYTLFITTLTDTKLDFEVQIFDDPTQPFGEDYSIRFKKK